MIELRVDQDSNGIRLDKFLRRKLSQVPTSHLFKMIRTKKVRVNGKRAQPEQTLATGDLLSIRGDAERLLTPEGKTDRPAVPANPSRLRVLLEDDWIMAVDKPSGLAVHPGSGLVGPTLVDYIRAYLGPSAVRNDFPASPAHRLDRDTSGVILVAKRRPAMVHFTEVFTEGKAKKRYWTLVKGKMVKPSGTIDTPLSEHQQTAESKSRRGVNYQEAISHYRVMRNGADCALLEVTIETGRTHQIRRHLSSVGHAVAGDKRYGDFAFNRDARARWGLKRLFLHAQRIQFPHPKDGQLVTIESPMPVELNETLQRAALSLP